jgi:hypothetical protein
MVRLQASDEHGTGAIAYGVFQAMCAGWFKETLSPMHSILQAAYAYSTRPFVAHGHEKTEGQPVDGTGAVNPSQDRGCLALPQPRPVEYDARFRFARIPLLGFRSFSEVKGARRHKVASHAKPLLIHPNGGQVGDDIVAIMPRVETQVGLSPALMVGKCGIPFRTPVVRGVNNAYMSSLPVSTFFSKRPGVLFILMSESAASLYLSGSL